MYNLKTAYKIRVNPVIFAVNQQNCCPLKTNFYVKEHFGAKHALLSFLILKNISLTFPFPAET